MVTLCQSDRVRLVSPLWYLAALLVVLGGWMAGTVVAAGAWEQVRSATLQNVTERIDAGDGSLAVFTDVRQPELDVRCTTRGPAEGAEAVPVDPAPIDLTVVEDGTTWYLIGWEPASRDGQAVRCRPGDGSADAATYRAAAVQGFADRARAGDGVLWIATVGGIALAVATWWSRRKHSQED